MCQHETCWCVSVTAQRPVWDRAVVVMGTVPTMPPVTAASAVSCASVLERLKTIVTRYHEKYTKSLAANGATRLNKLCGLILSISS